MVPCFVSYRWRWRLLPLPRRLHAGEAIDTDNAETRTRKTGRARTTKPARQQRSRRRPRRRPRRRRPSPHRDRAATPAATAAKYGPGVYAHFTTNQGSFIVRLVRQGRAEHGAELHRAGGRQEGVDRPANQIAGPPALLQQPDVPSHHSELHDSGRRSDRHRHWRARLQVHRRDQPEAEARQAGHPVDGQSAGRTPTAGSSSSRVAPYPSLDGKYSIFGEVVEGLDRVVAISKVPTSGPKGDPPNKPLSPVVMKSVRIERVSGSAAGCRGRGRRVRGFERGQEAREQRQPAGRSHRPSQPSSVPAAALSGGDGRAQSVRHRGADSRAVPQRAERRDPSGARHGVDLERQVVFGDGRELPFSTISSLRAARVTATSLIPSGRSSPPG